MSRILLRDRSQDEPGEQRAASRRGGLSRRQAAGREGQRGCLRAGARGARRRRRRGRRPPPADRAPGDEEPSDAAARALTTAPDRNELERLEGEGKHSRARLELYRQRSYSGKADSSRMRELQRAADAAEARLKAARAR